MYPVPPPPPRMPQALLAPPAPSPGGVCFPDFSLPREEEKVALSPEIPTHSQAQHSPRLSPQNIHHRPARLQMRQQCPCHFSQ